MDGVHNRIIVDPRKRVLKDRWIGHYIWMLLNFPTQYGNWIKDTWENIKQGAGWTSPRSTGIESYRRLRALRGCRLNCPTQYGNWISTTTLPSKSNWSWTSPRSTGIEMLCRSWYTVCRPVELPHAVRELKLNPNNERTKRILLNFPTQYGNWNSWISSLR